MTAIKLIQKGNTKLHNCYMFNIPANLTVCNRLCKNCYALKEQKRWPNTNIGREKRYQASLQPDFASRIIKEIQHLRKPPKYFRIHASGEFYSQSYVDSWTKIVKAIPNIVFYAYTKRKQDFDFSELGSLSNFVLIDSLQYSKLNYGKLEKAPKEAFVCPSYDKTVKCGETCTYCMTKGKADVTGVYFKQH